MTYRYRLLRGIHSQGGKTYEPGEVVESETDITPIMNIPGVPPRVSLLSSDQAPAAVQRDAVEDGESLPSTDDLGEEYEDDGLDGMTIAKLRVMANDLEIDVAGEKKAGIVRKIREATD